MNDQDCVQFLQWALPRLHMRWPGFRKVHGQVCKRLSARIRELSLPDLTAYRDYLEQHPAEWQVLDSLCRVTITRFYRDKRMFQLLQQEVLPSLIRTAAARGERELRCWSIGCASGEEPYTLALLWDLSFRHAEPGVKFRITATDADQDLLDRAREGCYPASSIKGLPKEWLAAAFVPSGERYCLREKIKAAVDFHCQDVRAAAPDGAFLLVLCRNIAFTYFDDGLQKESLDRIRAKLLPGGALVTGIHESLPGETEGFELWSMKSGVYRRSGRGLP